jgi:transposase-like protein
VGKRAGVDSGMRANVPIYVADRMKALKHENRELRQVSEMPRKASMYFAMAEFDRPLKR